MLNLVKNEDKGLKTVTPFHIFHGPNAKHPDTAKRPVAGLRSTPRKPAKSRKEFH